jgi:hypothetical protein
MIYDKFFKLPYFFIDTISSSYEDYGSELFWLRFSSFMCLSFGFLDLWNELH